MTMLDIDKVRPDVPSDSGRADVVLDQPLQLVVGEYLVVARDLEPAVQQWMAEGNARLEALWVCWPTKPAGMRQLKADDRIAGSGEALPMYHDRQVAQACQVRLVGFDDHQLVRVGSGVRRTAMASPPQMSLAPLSPKRRQRRQTSSVMPPLVVPSQPSIG